MFDDNGIEDTPLAREFGMVPRDSIDEALATLEIPDTQEARDLHLIIDFALKAYKDIMDNMALVQPKNRVKNYEVAERFLAQAKDARYKLEYLALQAKKVSGQKPKSDKSKASEGEGQKPSGKSRSELYAIK